VGVEVEGGKLNKTIPKGMVTFQNKRRKMKKALKVKGDSNHKKDT